MRNTYTGGTVINAGGIVKVSNNSALGTAGVTVNSGGELLLNGVTLANSLSLMGTGVGTAGAVATTGATANVLKWRNYFNRWQLLWVSLTSGDSLSVAGITGAGFGLTEKGAGNLIQTGAFSGTGSSLLMEWHRHGNAFTSKYLYRRHNY